jgi:hypothetical protein
VAGQQVPAAVNGSAYPAAEGDPVAHRERASVFGPTGRHRSDTMPPQVRPGPDAAAAVQAGGLATPSWTEPADPNGSPAPAPRAPLPDPLRPGRGQEPSRQRFAGGPAAPEPTAGHGALPGAQASTAPQAGLDQIRRSVGDGTHRGLPRRVRQASLAPQLRDRGEPAARAAGPSGDPAARSPEEIRTMMASLQDGWQRGRVDHLDQVDDGPEDWPGGRPTGPGGSDGGAWS